jgi:hypothetical protein
VLACAILLSGASLVCGKVWDFCMVALNRTSGEGGGVSRNLFARLLLLAQSDRHMHPGSVPLCNCLALFSVKCFSMTGGGHLLDIPRNAYVYSHCITAYIAVPLPCTVSASHKQSHFWSQSVAEPDSGGLQNMCCVDALPTQHVLLVGCS